MRFLLPMLFLMACGTPPNFYRDAAYPFYRIIDKERWADISDAPRKYHGRASDPEDGAWYVLFAEGDKFCPVNEHEFNMAAPGTLYSCNWRFAPRGL